MDWSLIKGNVHIWIERDVPYDLGLVVLIADFTARACALTITLTTTLAAALTL